MKTITEILAEFRTKPGLMNANDVLTLKNFLTDLKDNLTIFTQIPDYQGTTVSEISCAIEKADWYKYYHIDYLQKNS